jgi:hypothetical protein
MKQNKSKQNPIVKLASPQKVVAPKPKPAKNPFIKEPELLREVKRIDEVKWKPMQKIAPKGKPRKK